MNERYSWKKMPEIYNASHYNDKDLQMSRRFVIVDNWTHREYNFPNYQKKDGVYVNMIDNSLWNQQFFNWLCSTAPDFCIHIPKEFLTPTLIEICINNTSKAEFAREIPNMTYEQSEKLVRRLPEAIFTINDGYITIELIKDALEKKPELLIEINSNFKYRRIKQLIQEQIDKDTLKKYFEKLTVDNRVQLIRRNSIIQEFLTTEMIEELLDSGQMRFENKFMHNNEVPTNAIPTKIINKNIADKMFKANSKALANIPEEFITYEMCEKAVRDDKIMISYVPTKFQLPKLHKILIDANPKNISLIPEDTLTDEVLKYAVSKNGIVLGNIPEPKRTAELCEIAVENNANALKFIPDKYKTSDMCKKAVIFNPKMIKFVPLKILTPEFIEEIKLMNLNFGTKELVYIQECLKTHEKMTGIPAENKDLSKKENQPNTNNELYNDCNNISINNLSMYFSNPSLQLFEKLNIKKLGELFTKAENPEFITSIKNPCTRQEIIGTVNLLKCKYLSRDPLIDIYDEEMTISDIAKSLGLSVRSYNAIVRGRASSYSSNIVIIPNNITSKQFYEKMREPSIKEELAKIRNLGENSVIEILEKVKIVIDYYDNVKKKKEENKAEDNLELLNLELQRLRKEKNKIDAQIDVVLAKIQEKILEQSKGGVSK